MHYLLDLPPKKEFPADIMESINLSKDDGEIKLDLLLFYAADALKEAIKDPEFNQRVIQEARNSPNQTANLIKVTKDLPAVSSMVQENLQRIKSEIEGRIFTEINSLSDIDANLVHAHSSNNINRKYELSLFIPNLESLDPLKQPIISPNISVNEEKNPELEDHIIAWYYKKDGTLTQITIGEEEAMHSTNPIFILDNAALENFPSEKQVFKEPDTRNARSITSFHTHEYLIGSSFEASGDSELHVTAVAIDPQGNATLVLRPGNQFTGTFILDKEIDKVPPSGIGQERTRWSQLFNLIDYQSDYAVFWNVFERDWNRSPKWIGSGSAYGNTIHLEGRRKYWDDVYLYDRDEPGQLQNDWPFMHDAFSTGAVLIWGTISGTTFYTRLWKVTS